MGKSPFQGYPLPKKCSSSRAPRSLPARANGGREKKGDEMKFTLTMDMGNAAFTENDEPEVEATRILHRLAEQLSSVSFGPGQVWPLLDYNGHKVGEAEVAG